MSSVFDGYERQYCELSTSLSHSLDTLPSLSPDEFQTKVQELSAGLDEAESLTRRMDLEARSLPPAQKASLLAKIRELKADLAQRKKEFKARVTAGPTSSSASVASHSSSSSSRAELLQEEGQAGLGGSGGGGGDGAARKQMLTATARLEHTSERIEQSRRVLLETEDLGVSVLEDLHQQRQTLLHARDTLYGVDDSIGRARQILNNMAKHVARNRWIVGLMIFILLAAIILVVVLKLKAHHQDS